MHTASVSTTLIVIANIIDFLAAMVQIYSGAVKDRKKILALQTIQLGMQSVSMALLGAVTGMINNLISCARNLVCYRDWMNWPMKILFIAVSSFLTLRFNTQGSLGLLPLAVCVVYILLMDIRDPIKFKILVTCTFAPWVFYFFVIRDYTGAFFAAATIVTNIVTLRKMIADQKRQHAAASALETAEAAPESTVSAESFSAAAKPSETEIPRM